jgi:sulfur carrier protein ThiS
LSKGKFYVFNAGEQTVMLIEIEISSALHDLIPVSGKNLVGDHWEVTAGTHPIDILNWLGLTGVPTILILNREVVTEKTILKEGDILRIFPLVSGG